MKNKPFFSACNGEIGLTQRTRDIIEKRKKFEDDDKFDESIMEMGSKGYFTWEWSKKE